MLKPFGRCSRAVFGGAGCVYYRLCDRGLQMRGRLWLSSNHAKPMIPVPARAHSGRRQ